MFVFVLSRESALYILMRNGNLEVYIAPCLKVGEILSKLETLPVIGHNCVLHWGFIVKPTEIQFDKKKTVRCET